MRDGVEGLQRLDVMIRMDLRFVDPDRHVEELRRCDPHRHPLDRLERLARNATGGAVHACAGDLATPVLRIAPSVVEVREGLAVEPALANERHLILDARLVLRRANARRVHEEAARLHVVEERRDERRVERVWIEHHRLGVVGDHRRDDRPEEHPGAVESLAYGLGGLSERRPDELVAAERQRHDEHPERPAMSRLGVHEPAHLSEVDLRLLTGWWIVDAHRGRLVAPRELLVGVAPERVVAGAHAVIASEQRMDLG